MNELAAKDVRKFVLSVLRIEQSVGCVSCTGCGNHIHGTGWHLQLWACSQLRNLQHGIRAFWSVVDFSRFWSASWLCCLDLELRRRLLCRCTGRRRRRFTAPSMGNEERGRRLSPSKVLTFLVSEGCSAGVSYRQFWEFLGEELALLIDDPLWSMELGLSLNSVYFRNSR